MTNTGTHIDRVSRRLDQMGRRRMSSQLAFAETSTTATS
jgi:hypothetical protein